MFSFFNGHEINNINTRQFDIFWEQYDSNNYTLDELKAITGIADDLLETFDRKFYGDFWTNSVFTNKAHDIMRVALGDSYRDDYMFWDMACGAKNLTRDYKFKNLYSSTLHAEELNIADGYNRDNVAFQYDFLNDDMHLYDMTREELVALRDAGKLGDIFKLPISLIEDLLDKKPVVFFTNPPYGQATSGQGKQHKTGDSKNTGISSTMDNMAHVKMELYTQFMYRCKLIAELFDYQEDDDLHIFYFTSAKFLTIYSFEKFRKDFVESFANKGGYAVNAGEFSGTQAV